MIMVHSAGWEFREVGIANMRKILLKKTQLDEIYERNIDLMIAGIKSVIKILQTGEYEGIFLWRNAMCNIRYDADIFQKRNFDDTVRKSGYEVFDSFELSRGRIDALHDGYHFDRPFEGGDGERSLDNGFIQHISEELFEAFVEWYGRRAEEFGYRGNDHKTPSVALQQLLRMFLEQDDAEERWMRLSGGDELAPEMRRFRESEHLSLAQAREIARKKDKDKKTTETFFSERGKDSVLMKNRKKRRLQVKEARANSTVPTTLGCRASRVLSADTVLAIANELQRDFLKVVDVAEFMDASVKLIRFALQLHTLMRPGEISTLRLSGLTVCLMSRIILNSAMPRDAVSICRPRS
ncbi:unnamed protein product [Bathycoccus prasinos]